MFNELVQSFLLIFFAEMGDKSQLLAMAFATRYSVKKVITGIFIGALLNHGLAVALGNYISSFIPITYIQIIAGFIFIVFSLLTLKPDKSNEEEEDKDYKFGPILTVASAFFMGELGDKTQLTAITLGSNSVYPLAVLTGTVTGMVFTGGIGIFIGKKLGDKVPELAMKISASSLFLFFGFTKLFQSIPTGYFSKQLIVLFVTVVFIIFFILVRVNITNSKKGVPTVYKTKSKELYDFYKEMETDISNICLGIDKCKKCQGEKCIIGYTKSIIKDSLGTQHVTMRDDFTLEPRVFEKRFDLNEVFKSYLTVIQFIFNDPRGSNNDSIHAIRKQLELILFNDSIIDFNNLDDYKKIAYEKNPKLALMIFSNLK